MIFLEQILERISEIAETRRDAIRFDTIQQLPMVTLSQISQIRPKNQEDEMVFWFKR